MYKLLLFVMLSVVFTMLSSIQIDQELSMNTFFLGKHSVNRAAHAAAQQIDLLKLSNGTYSIDENEARKVAIQYLQENLRLNENLEPQPNAYLKSKIEIKLFYVVNENVSFPYVFNDPTYQYTVTVKYPAVIMIVQLKYPQAYNLLPPITWHIKVVAEMNPS
jgi:hypothetical protein